MALIAHRMMLPKRPRRTLSTQQHLVTNKVGVLVVPTLADYLYEHNHHQAHLQQNVIFPNYDQTQYEHETSVCIPINALFKVV